MDREELTPSPSLAVVGVGAMGGAVVRRLLACSVPTLVYDVDNGAVARAVAAGATAAESLSEVGEADIVLLFLADDRQVEQVLDGDGGLLVRLERGSTVVIQSTVHPETCRRMSERAAERGVDVLDAPVTGAVVGAERGVLTTFVGGERSAAERVRPTLSSFSRHVLYMGGIGSGQITKLMNNLLVMMNALVASEALRVVEGLGLDPASVRAAVLEGSGASRALAGTDADGFGAPWESLRKTLEDRQNPIAFKDFGLALELARGVGVSSPLAAAGWAFLTNADAT